jgi:hypothetical protein
MHRWHQPCLPGRSSIAERADEYPSYPEAKCAVYSRDTSKDRTRAADIPRVSAPQIPVRRWTRTGDRVIFDYMSHVLIYVQWPERADERDFRAAFEEENDGRF